MIVTRETVGIKSIKTPVHVLHVIHSFTYGGIENNVLNIVRYSNRRLVTFDICTVGQKVGNRRGEAESLGSRVLSCPIRRSYLGFPLMVFRPDIFVRDLVSLFRRERYDVIHSHINFANGLVMRAAYLAGVPVRISHVYTVLDWATLVPFGGLFTLWMRSLIGRYATLKLGDSKMALGNVYGPRWMQDPRSMVHYCGIDPCLFGKANKSHSEIRRDFNLPDTVPVMGHVGRFSEPKNHAFLLDVFGEFLVSRPNAHLLFVGDGSLREMIENRVRDRNLSSHVLFAGTQVSVPEAMLAMDIFVFPSVYESLPLVVWEAQASGLRCLVSDRVTDEVDLVPGAVQRLTLEAGSKEWAHAVNAILAQGRLDMVDVENGFDSGPGSVQRSIEMLQEIYVNQFLKWTDTSVKTAKS